MHLANHLSVVGMSTTLFLLPQFVIIISFFFKNSFYHYQVFVGSCVKCATIRCKIVSHLLSYITALYIKRERYYRKSDSFLTKQMLLSFWGMCCVTYQCFYIYFININCDPHHTKFIVKYEV